METSNNNKLSTSSLWQSLFSPNSVAVIGASNVYGSWGCRIMQRLLAPGKRKVYPVNPTSSEILGVPSYRSVLDIPDAVDLAVIVVSAEKVPLVFQECAQKGVKAVEIISGGFAETDEQGSQLQNELAELARKTSLHFLGPNSMGHANTSSQLNTLAYVEEIIPGPVALLTQSGNMGARINRIFASAGMGFEGYVCTGNEADLHLEDYLEYFGKDKDIRVIVAYIEGLREARRFLRLAKEITLEKPIVVLKTGGTSGATKAAHSHTGALTGSDTIYTAAFKQAGIIRVDYDDELCDVTAALLNQPLPRGNRVGILTMGGGFGVTTADYCEREGLEIAQLELATVEKLSALLPPRWPHSNPVDMVGLDNADDSTILSFLGILLKDKNIDAILSLTALRRTSRLSPNLSEEEIKAIQARDEKSLHVFSQRAKECKKPVVMVGIVPQLAPDLDATAVFRREGIPVYPNPHRAARVLCHLARYRQYLETART